MEKSNYAETQFISRNQIEVHILSKDQFTNKYGDYYRSHMIKVKNVR